MLLRGDRTRKNRRAPEKNFARSLAYDIQFVGIKYLMKIDIVAES